jgi:glycosyltransferase involved in cell wall biosynthesis
MTIELAAVVLTHNSEDQIVDCLDSLTWTDIQVVFDDLSHDRTLDLAREHGAQIMQHKLVDFASQRTAALEAVKADWIFFVDSDERATPLVAEEVRRVIRYSGQDAHDGWWIPRHNYMAGHRMRGGGWYPDHQLRLLRRGFASYDPKRKVHETVVLQGEAGYLEEPLVHLNYDSVAQFREKTKQYTLFEAQILLDQGVRVRPWTRWTMPLREFWRRFFVLEGYRDHIYGLIFCGLMARYAHLTYTRLEHLQATQDR